MASFKQSIVNLKNALLRLYYTSRTWKPVWTALNAEPRRLYASSRPELSDEQAAVVRDLAADGIALTHLDDLFPGRGLLEEMQQRAGQLESVAVPNLKKLFLTQLIDLYTTLDFDEVFVRFALSDEVLGCVAGYLQMWPAFYVYTLTVTNPVAAGEEPRQSQRWHRDPEDRKMCKVFIYLTDVDASSGPFTYIRGSMASGPLGHLFRQRPPLGYYPPEGEVERSIPQERIMECTGRAGTVIFADTSGLHKGGYATEKRRILSTNGFVTKAYNRGVFFTRPQNFSQRIGTMGRMAQYALQTVKLSNRKMK